MIEWELREWKREIGPLNKKGSFKVHRQPVAPTVRFVFVSAFFVLAVSSYSIPP
jgi:hypothetical protein